MKHSALGLGRFPLEATMRCQADGAAPESGAGDPAAKEWDWNSPYWRRLGSPWGGVHASAPDVARFFAEFLDQQGRAVRPETAALMPAITTPTGCRHAVWDSPSAPGPAARAAPRRRSAIAGRPGPWPGPTPGPTRSASCSRPYPAGPASSTRATSSRIAWPRR